MKTTFLIHKNFLVIIFSFISLIAFSQNGCWKQIKSGRAHTIAIKNDGTLWAWGSNTYGQRGDNTGTASILTAVQIGTENNWQQIVAGDYHSLAIKNNGTLWAWGQNNLGQLSGGPTANIVVPTQIGTDNNWQQVTTGRQHSTAIKLDGTLWAWGYNGNGAIGDGTLIDKLVPTQIGTDTNWLKVTDGYYHTLAIKNNFTLWSWGWNVNGEIGIGTISDAVLIPTQVGTNADWIQIAGGNAHSVAIKINGTLWCWGANSAGQLGNGLSLDLLVPTQIGNQNNWLKVEAGLGHNIALKTDGTLWTWGLNNYGQIGNGTQISSSPYGILIPTKIGTDTDWSRISAGSHHSFAIKNNDNLWDWGYNSSGILGDNTTVMKLVPTFIDCNTLSINAINSNALIHLFPNPTNSNLNIQTLNNVVISKIIITDLTDKVVLTQTTNTTQVNVEPLATGMYIIEAFSGQEKFTSKFIKQ
jgi:alpha-tubulin suppressor-like RCC1 family protein